MKKWGALGVAVALLGLLVLIYTPGGSQAGMKVGVPQFPAGIAVGDNYAEDTLWVMGHIKIDSTATVTGAVTMTNLTVPYLSIDSAAVSTLFRISQGGTFYGDSALVFDGFILTVDSVRVGGGSFFDGASSFSGDATFSGGTVTLDSANIDSMDVGTHLTAVIVTASGLGSFAGVTVTGGILTADSANIDSIDVGTHLTATAFTGGTVTVSGGLLTADSANIDSIDVGTHLTATVFTGGTATISGGLLTADSVNVDSIDVSAHATVATFTAGSGVVNAGLLTVDSLNADSIDVATHATLATFTAGSGTVNAGMFTADSAIIDTADIQIISSGKMYADKEFTIFADSTLYVNSGRLVVDSMRIGQWASLNKDAQLIADSSLIVSGGVLTLDSARVSSALIVDGILGSASGRAGLTLNADTVDANNYQLSGETLLLPSVFSVGQADSITDNIVHAIIRFPFDSRIMKIGLISATAPTCSLRVAAYETELPDTTSVCDTLLCTATSHLFDINGGDGLILSATEACSLSVIKTGNKGGHGPASFVIWYKPGF